MKRVLYIVLLSALFFVFSIISLLMYKSGNMNCFYILGTVSIFIIMALIWYINNSRSELSIYNIKLKKILKTYESILVKSSNIPNLKGKNILIIDNFEDVVDAQTEIRKPIYYYIEDNSCSFMLKDNEDVLLYTLKTNVDIESSVEKLIQEYEIEQNKAKDTIDKEVLENLDKTTVFVIDDKLLKISPLRKEKAETEVPEEEDVVVKKKKRKKGKKKANQNEINEN